MTGPAELRGPGDLMGLDAVTVLTDDRAEGTRSATNTWEVFATHFPRKPVVPGVVMLGCLERLAQHHLQTRTGEADWRLTTVGRARFRTFVQPGDTMTLVLDLKDLDEHQATYRAAVEVAGRAVTTFKTLALTRGGST